MKKVHQIKLLREASSVSRLHMKRTIKPYQNGKHSFDMLTLLLALNPTASRNLLLAVVEHDLPERFSSDMSYPCKSVGLMNTEVQEEVENLFWIKAGGPWSESLTEEEEWWLKFVDLLELFYFCKDEERLGNTSLSNIMVKIRDIFRKIQMPEDIDIRQLLDGYPNDMPDVDDFMREIVDYE